MIWVTKKTGMYIRELSKSGFLYYLRRGKYCGISETEAVEFWIYSKKIKNKTIKTSEIFDYNFFVVSSLLNDISKKDHEISIRDSSDNFIYNKNIVVGDVKSMISYLNEQFKNKKAARL